MAKTADEFVRTYNGKAIDDDKAFGVQCVDAFRVFTKWAINKVWTTGGTGRANGYWYNRGRYKDYFDAVDTKHLRNGDWVIWDVNSKSHPESHIAMYYNGQEFSQNQGGNREFCLKDTDFSDCLGALRWKGFPKTAPQPAKPANANIEQMARDVIAGKYGNGDQRKKALGTNYNAVQARVNQILSGKAPAPAFNVEQAARDVIAGKYGNGAERQRRLGSHYNEVQARVNQILRGK